MRAQGLVIRCITAFALTSAWICASAQNPGTGSYKFSNLDSFGFDSINPGNLNVHFAIPIVQKTGRGLPFQYTLEFDGLVWLPIQSGSSKVWSPDPYFGFYGELLNDGYKGFLSYSERTVKCYDDPSDPGYFEFVPYQNGYVYHDEFGASHSFYYTNNWCSGVVTGDGSTSDGSGFSFDGATVHSSSGVSLALPEVVNGSTGPLTGTITDSNGNKITNNQNGTFTDTMGLTPLTISGTGTPSSPRVFTYSTTNNGTATVKITYAAKTVKTNFLCSGASAVTDYGPLSVNLPVTITLGDNTSAYSIAYEPTPGYSGDVTGRIASITLPTGGTIYYTYSGSNNGINCADGTPIGISRSTSIGADGTTSYTRSSITSTTSHTEVKGPHKDASNNNDETEIDFVIAAGLPFETTRSVYSGSHVSGSLLAKTDTCYNAKVPPNCTTQALSLPVNQVSIFRTMGSFQNGSDTSYNPYGLPIDIKEYEYGSGTRGSLLRETKYGYALLGGYLTDKVSNVQVYDGGNHQYSGITYGYDEQAPTTASPPPPQHIAVSGPRGNMTSQNVWTSSSKYLRTQYTFDDAGQVLSATDMNTASNGYSYPAATIYKYDSATDALLNTLTLPSPNANSQVFLRYQFGYDSNTGLLTSAVDPNNKPTTYQYDSMLRLKEVDYPDTGKTVLNYSSPTQTGTYTYQTATTSTDTEVFYDGMGRQIRVAVNNGQATNPWYEIDTCPNATGLTSFTSYPYQSSSNTNSEVCSGAGDTITYDALGRLQSVSRGDGLSTTFAYTSRASQVTDENGVSRISQVDGLGRTKTVCEISSHTLPPSDSPVNCLLDRTGTGYLTTYVYDDANLKTTITQGVQTRVFQSDWVGRPLLIQEPERGQTTFGYDFNTNGLIVTRKRPQPNQLSASTLTTTNTQYDAAGRVITISYSDGTPTKNFKFDLPTGWSGYSTDNIIGRLTQAYVTNSSGFAFATTGFAYDSMGRVTQMGECTPSTCGVGGYNLAYTYDLDGNLISSSDGGGTTTTYAVSRAGELTSLTSSLSNGSNPANLVSNVKNGPNGPTSLGLGNGLSRVNSYDTVGRMDGGWICSGSTSPYCSGGSQTYGFTTGWKGVQNPLQCDTVLNKCMNFGYDEFNRLTSRSITTGTADNYTYSYDRYGNRLHQTALSGGKTVDLNINPANNQIAVTGGSCSIPVNASQYCYDAAGNMIADGFHTYTYDAEGNVTKVDTSAGQYTYDALNRRVSTTAGAVTKEFVFDQFGRRVSIWNASTHAQLQGQYYWGDQPVAYYDSATHFQHQDWMGTERIRTSYNGGVDGTFTSLPFGDLLTQTKTGGIDTDASHFASLDRDTESYTDHAQFRQYSNTQGRWLSPDLYGGSYDFGNPQSYNRYAYVTNNPLDVADPLGLEGCQYGGDFCITGWGRYPTDPTGGYGGASGGGSRLPPPAPFLDDNAPHQRQGGRAPNNISCTQLAAGQVPDSSSNWGQGALNTAKMFFAWEYGVGNTSTDFGPNSVESQQMMSAYGLAANVNSFLNGGPSSGFQNFGLGGLLSSGLNPTAQFVGSYGWNMSLSGGYLNITLTNATTPFSFFGHAPGLNPNPPIRPSTGWHPMGRVNQIFHISVKCGA